MKNPTNLTLTERIKNYFRNNLAPKIMIPVALASLAIVSIGCEKPHGLSSLIKGVVSNPSYIEESEGSKKYHSEYLWQQGFNVKYWEVVVTDNPPLTGPQKQIGNKEDALEIFRLAEESIPILLVRDKGINGYGPEDEIFDKYAPFYLKKGGDNNNPYNYSDKYEREIAEIRYQNLLDYLLDTNTRRVR